MTHARPCQNSVLKTANNRNGQQKHETEVLQSHQNMHQSCIMNRSHCSRVRSVQQLYITPLLQPQHHRQVSGSTSSDVAPSRFWQYRVPNGQMSNKIVTSLVLSMISKKGRNSDYVAVHEGAAPIPLHMESSGGLHVVEVCMSYDATWWNKSCQDMTDALLTVSKLTMPTQDFPLQCCQSTLYNEAHCCCHAVVTLDDILRFQSHHAFQYMSHIHSAVKCYNGDGLRRLFC